MLVAPDVPPNHGTVLVELDGTRYVVDASILHRAPLPLHEDRGITIDHPAWGVRCVKRAQHWYISFRPMHRPLGLECRLDQLSATREAFHERHAQTRAWSPFNYELHARLIRGEAIVGVACGQRVAFDAGGGVSQSPLPEAERRRVLVDELDVHFTSPVPVYGLLGARASSPLLKQAGRLRSQGTGSEFTKQTSRHQGRDCAPVTA
jgi:N-hydroxyarylamine O-acetyltransferase